MELYDKTKNCLVYLWTAPYYPEDRTDTDFGKALDCINRLMNASLSQASIKQAKELLGRMPKTTSHFDTILALINTGPVSDEKIKNIYDHRDALMNLSRVEILNLRYEILSTDCCIEN